MNDYLKTAIQTLVTKSTESIHGPESMNYAQAALNLAHTFATLTGADALAKSK